ncbi:aminoglycoside phosphotransferase family protein [Paenibacillus sp. FSL K6-1230]|uniref:aminoglycoside phosphotransferase family protein n=1 Tax=Paenibacillus sp. FSL K6-1230 TaxID=2921603 RepID=UPI0030FCBD4A
MERDYERTRPTGGLATNWLRQVLEIDVGVPLQSRELKGGASAQMLKWSVGPSDLTQYAGPRPDNISDSTVDANRRPAYQAVVMRLFTDAAWLQQEPDLPVHESEALRAAATTGLPVPFAIARDTDGSIAGMPAVLMSFLPGKPYVQPAPPELPCHLWVGEMGRVLALLHASSASLAWSYSRYTPAAELRVPSWSREPEAWQFIIDHVQQGSPAYQPVFIHRDYHPGNLLWDQGKISGVVDWVNACMGPAGADTGHCRVNLAILGGEMIADSFMNSYLNAGGLQEASHPYWDMNALTDFVTDPLEVHKGWLDLGLPMTTTLMAARLDKYALEIAARARNG